MAMPAPTENFGGVESFQPEPLLVLGESTYPDFLLAQFWLKSEYYKLSKMVDKWFGTLVIVDGSKILNILDNKQLPGTLHLDTVHPAPITPTAPIVHTAQSVAVK